MISLRPSSMRLILILLITITYTSTLHAKSEGNAADKIPNSIPEILSGLTAEILSGLTDNTSPAPAWTKIKETLDGVRYVDYLSIQRVGNKVILWSLTDHKLAEDEDFELFAALFFEQAYPNRGALELDSQDLL